MSEGSWQTEIPQTIKKYTKKVLVKKLKTANYAFLCSCVLPAIVCSDFTQIAAAHTCEIRCNDADYMVHLCSIQTHSSTAGGFRDGTDVLLCLTLNATHHSEGVCGI